MAGGLIVRSSPPVKLVVPNGYASVASRVSINRHGDIATSVIGAVGRIAGAGSVVMARKVSALCEPLSTRSESDGRQ
jgi:hypothetical protein